MIFDIVNSNYIYYVFYTIFISLVYSLNSRDLDITIIVINVELRVRTT